VQHGAVLGRHVLSVDDVLDRHRHAVQRARGPALTPLPVAGARLPERVLRVEKRPRLYALVHFVHAREAGFGQLLGADRAVADRTCSVGRRKPIELRGIHAVLSVRRSGSAART
jgi:hypothetical protein